MHPGSGLAVPEEADVYTILKYLAIVSPRQGRRLAASQDRNVFQIVFCASPERLVEAGWELGGSNMRLLTPDQTFANGTATVREPV